MEAKDLVDVSELNLSYKLKSKIPFDVKKNTLVTYLDELKEFDNRYVSKPVKFSKRIGYFFVLLLFGLFSLIFFYEAFSNVIKVFQNKFPVTETNYLLELSVPRLFIPPITIFSFLLAGSIMLVAAIFFAMAITLGVYTDWTNYHSQLYILTNSLHENGQLEEFIGYHNETKSFHLTKMSINWEMEWIYPFIYTTLPPYFQETGEISLYLFALISFPLPLLVTIISGNLVFFTALSSLVLFLGSMAIWRTQKLIQTHRTFRNLQHRLIIRQQEKLVHLLHAENVNQGLIHANQENLYRLSSERSIPTTFPLVPLSILLPLISAILGYVIYLS